MKTTLYFKPKYANHPHLKNNWMINMEDGYSFRHPKIGPMYCQHGQPLYDSFSKNSMESKRFYKYIEKRYVK